MAETVYVQPKRIIGFRCPMIYGHFLEHFHREIYGGLYDPESPSSDADGMRKDVITAIRRIKPAIIRWPGGCFASAYHWQHGVGARRQSCFDKSWRVEESNRFGTDEFVSFCRKVAAEPYICTNAGTGTPEEMSQWVEYCNLKTGGQWATRRIRNGNPEPFKVKFWSIGNENYLGGEMGSKSIAEWGTFVRESAKMMKRVDPSIEIAAACMGVDQYYTIRRAPYSPVDWNLSLLKEAGHLLDWISVHGYWDRLYRTERTNATYETCMAYTLDIEKKILSAKYALGLSGYLGKIRVAFDEWNLRGWYHPHIDSDTEDYLTPRDENDINSTYTMADAVFAACFLNCCLRHCDLVGMANFSPTVNARGAIFTHRNGIVLRPTYHVFDLYANSLGDTVIDSWIAQNQGFEDASPGRTREIPDIDVVATKFSGRKGLAFSVVNRSPDSKRSVDFQIPDLGNYRSLSVQTVNGPDKDAYNDIDFPDRIRITKFARRVKNKEKLSFELEPHSVSVLVLE